MRTNWSDIKRIIGELTVSGEKYITLISNDGLILKANSRMVRSLQLGQIRETPVNLFDLLHPLNKEHFLDQMMQSGNEAGRVSCVEAYLKNGIYHPMKWHITELSTGGSGTSYLCQGYRLMDEARTREYYKLGEHNYRLIFNNLDTGILFQDTLGEIIAVNQRIPDMLNMSLEQLYQLKRVGLLWNKCRNICNEEGIPVSYAKSPFMKALRTRKIQAEVLVFHLQNGDQRWLQISSQPLFRDNSTIPYGVVSSITDHSMEKNLIRELKERKAVLHSFMKQTPNLAWVVDEQGNLLFASRFFYEFFSLDEAASAQKNILELVPPAIAETLYESHLTVLETGKPADLIRPVKWADGTDYVFHIDIFPLEGASGKKMLGGHAVNLTDKYEAEKKLRDTNERLLHLSRATSNAIWEWDMQTGQIFRNEALMEIIGYQSAIPNGLSWWLRRIHPEDRNRVADAVKQSTEEGKLSWEGEYRFKCADGEYKFMRDKGFIVYENGLPVKMIGALQDVSTIKELEKRLIEEKLKRHKDVSELVIQAQEKERTQIGHELHDNVNQILSSAKLFFDMLEPDSSEQILYKSKGIEYISLAVEEIRKLSRELVAPRLVANNLVMCVNQLIEDTQMASPLDIQFEYSGEPDCFSNGKQVTLFRILQEQIKNIIKHSNAQKVLVNLESNSNEIILTVFDNGNGFDANQTFQGIGLSNIFERVRFYNGDVKLDTAPGKGCKLIIYLPVSD